jgi:hypothetical protein
LGGGLVTGLVARSFRPPVEGLAALVRSVVTADDPWTVLFTPTAATVSRLNDPATPPLDQVIWGHVFDGETELRWRLDAGQVQSVAVGRLPASLETGTADDLALELAAEAAIELPLLGHRTATGWGADQFRPGALGYHVDELGPNESDVLVIVAEALLDTDQQPAYHRYRELDLWRAS